MLYIASFILLSLFLALLVNAAPGDDFKLQNFYLEEPSEGDTISGEELEDGYADKYFYSDGDAMAFYVPTSGDDTYPRCELREQCQAGSNSYNWDLSVGTHQLYGTYEIGSSTTADYFIIAQIHSKNGPGKPLLKIRYNDGYIRTELKTDSGGSNEEKTQIKENGGDTYVGKGNKFTLKIQVLDTKVKVWLDGDRMIYEDVSYWDDYYCYFKTGNYKTQKDSEGVKSYVKIHSLSISHSDSSSCKYTSSFLYETDENDNEVLSTAGIILIVLAVIIALALCGIAGYCYYKKKYLPSKGQAGFKDSVDDTYKAGDTPKGNDDKNERQTGAYDMTEIEIDHDVETEAVEH